MILDTLGAFTLILSFFLCAYNIRSLVFFRTSKKMIQQQDQLLYHNNNYFSDSLFKIRSEDNSYLYHDDKIALDKDPENTDDTNTRVSIQKVNNAFSDSNSKRLTPKKSCYNNTNSNIGYSSPSSFPTIPFISILVPARNEDLVIDRLMRSCAALTLSRKTLHFTNKTELLFTGLQYVKFIPLLALIIIDCSMILLSTPAGLFYMISNNDLVKLSLLVQAANLFANIGIIFISIPLCRNIRNYNTKDALYFIFLTLLTVPFLVFGSLRGIIRNEGIFYRTKRNS
jgi:hypothetical protein